MSLPTRQSLITRFTKLLAGARSSLHACALGMLGICLITPVGHAAEVKLAWDASGSQGVNGYRVYYGEASGSYTASGSPADAGNQLSYTVPNLLEGKTYYFAVKAYGAASESPPSNEVSQTIPAAAAPFANFTATPTSGPAPLTVNFGDASTGNITAWSWNFGDGTTSTGQTAIKTYANPGTYTVALTVSGPSGNNTATKNSLISVAAAPTTPIADFSATPTSGTPPLTVRFTDSSTGDITNRSWDFGDGGTSTWRNPSHSYAAAGTYTVALTVTGPGGTNTKTQTGYITVAAAGAPPPPSPDPNPDPTPDPGTPTLGLVAAYGFEELTGGQVDDSSGQANHGVISGASRTDSGRFGKALTFDGSNDWVSINDSASLDLTSGMTIELWVFPTQTMSGWRCPLLKERPSGLVYSLCANTDANRPSTAVFINGDRNLTGGSALPRYQWTHLAATYDGTSQRLYVNGTEIARQPLSGSIQASDRRLYIGGNSVWGEFFSGRIDEVRVYNRGLTASEIQSDMATPVLQ